MAQLVHVPKAAQIEEKGKHTMRDHRFQILQSILFTISERSNGLTVVIREGVEDKGKTLLHVLLSL